MRRALWLAMPLNIEIRVGQLSGRLSQVAGLSGRLR
jgi:hypothetical protein